MECLVGRARDQELASCRARTMFLAEPIPDPTTRTKPAHLPNPLSQPHIYQNITPAQAKTKHSNQPKTSETHRKGIFQISNKLPPSSRQKLHGIWQIFEAQINSTSYNNKEHVIDSTLPTLPKPRYVPYIQRVLSSHKTSNLVPRLRHKRISVVWVVDSHF